MQSKPPAFLHNAVCHLLLDDSSDWSLEETKNVLKLCTGVINFAAGKKIINPTVLPILADMKVQRMAAFFEDLFGDAQFIHLSHRALSSITHLDIFDEIEPGETDILLHIPMLPALTHLRMHNDVPWDTIQQLLTDCPRLTLLAVLWRHGGGYRWANNAPISDMRFVVAFFLDYWGDWERGARGFPDFWSVANEFVAEKRRGLIRGTCSLAAYFLSDPASTQKIVTGSITSMKHAQSWNCNNNLHESLRDESESINIEMKSPP